MSSYLVTGATGNVGGATVAALAERGEPVRAVVRDPSKASLPSGVEVVAGDLNDASTVSFDGIRGFFLMAGYGGQDDLLAAAQAAGVERIALLSGSSTPGGDMSNAVARYQILAERAVRESGLGWTFLQPSSFMTNTLDWRDQLAAGDVVRAPFAEVRVAVIDPADIGAVAAEVLVSGEHDGRAYRLSGPEALTPADRLAILARVLDRPLRLEGMTNDEARADFAKSMPPEYVDAFMSFFADGTLDESPVLPTVQDVLGRAPRSFEDWARANAAAFMR
jgi:uncharacterized protein YbjT (DUF2867 family)